VGRLCTRDELCQQVEAYLGKLVLPVQMNRVLPAFTRIEGGGRNVNGEGFMHYGFGNYVTNTLSRRFHEGQAVMMSSLDGVGAAVLGKRNTPTHTP
jgi:hypothetical protein